MSIEHWWKGEMINIRDPNPNVKPKQSKQILLSSIPNIKSES